MPRVRSNAEELNPQPLPPRSGPVPDPWREAAVAYVVELVIIQELAQTVANKQLQQDLLSGADSAMGRFFDDFCDTPWHGPFPHQPSYLAWALAVELVSAANAGSSSFREGMLRAAGQLADKAFAAANQNAPAFAR